LEQVAALRPDLVLMDIQLAGAISGIEATPQIRKNELGKTIALTQHQRTAATRQRPPAHHRLEYRRKRWQPRLF
ncbi:MAG: response regulator, partial [Gemmatimonadetes bacterium]|nr:response regulator [Gemmatimonadota bacterium]